MNHWRGLAGLVVGVVLVPGSAVWAADPDPIARAVEQGVKRLKEWQQPGGTWQHGHKTGVTALAGLTLLESGVDARDPAIQKAAQVLRNDAIDLNHTYSLALAIWFFDRLGDPGDVPLIQALGVRLLAGQNDGGGWTYHCPTPGGKEETQRLTTLVKRRSELVAGTELPRTTPKTSPGNTRTLPKEFQAQLVSIQQQKAAALANFQKAGRGGGDNSNTQFAILGLWVARRHGVPVDRALALVDARFRSSQNKDGGWGYQVNGGSSDAMTCAGLLGLAAVHGAYNEAVLTTDPKALRPGAGGVRPRVSNPANDPAIRAGLMSLGATIEHPKGNKRPKNGPAGARRGSRSFYFLWSVERVAVAYGLRTIGNKDWYNWGAEILLDSQQPDGGWGNEIDTCFALLFLRRANLAQDLTASLKGRVKDPGEVTLTVGGVGGEELLARALKPGVDPRDQENARPNIKDPAGDPGKDRPGPVPPTPDHRGSGDDEAAKLCAELVKAPPGQQGKVLENLKDSKGVVYTLALAAAIPKLSGDSRNRAREALAERLTRMTSATLRDKFRDDDPEVRRAAVRASAAKEDRSHIPDLIPLLEDREPAVAATTHFALRVLSGQDFGPLPTASAAERAKSVAAWQAWWKKQGNN